MPSTLLSICIPSVSHDELVQQLASIIKLRLNYHDKVEIIVKLDKSSKEDCTTIRKIAQENNVQYLEQTNLGFDRDVGQLIASAKGEYVWIVSSNDLLDEDILPNIIQHLQISKYDLLFLNSRTPNSRDAAIKINSDAVLTGLGATLRVIGTRMSLVTSIIFRNSNEKTVLSAYSKYSNSAIAFLVFPFSKLSAGGKTYVIAKPQFTNFVHELGISEIAYYNAYDTFGISLWDIVSDYTRIQEDRHSRDFLIKNFGHVWRGGVIDWVRRKGPRPMVDIWRLRRYQISHEYWPVLFLTAMPKPLIKFALVIYKTIVRTHYS